MVLTFILFILLTMLSQAQENNSASVVVDDLIRWTSTESEKQTEVQKGKPTANSTPFEVNLSAMQKMTS